MSNVESKAQRSSPWWSLASVRSSWRRWRLPCRNTAPSQASVSGTCAVACTARRRRVMQGCSTRHLGFVGQFNPLKFPKRIWLIWLLSVNGCICLIVYFGSQWFNNFIGFIGACITWLLCIHWLPWLHRLRIRPWLIVCASCHRVNRIVIATIEHVKNGSRWTPSAYAHRLGNVICLSHWLHCLHWPFKLRWLQLGIEWTWHLYVFIV